jgi:hypothetical protein
MKWFALRWIVANVDPPLGSWRRVKCWAKKQSREEARTRRRVGKMSLSEALERRYKIFPYG